MLGDASPVSSQVLPMFSFLLYTSRVMTIYEVPPTSPHQRQFRSVRLGRSRRAFGHTLIFRF
jgi:hypothetical protein